MTDALALPLWPRAEGEVQFDQEVKDRWAFALRPDPRREEILAVTDQAAIRAYLERGR